MSALVWRRFLAAHALSMLLAVSTHAAAPPEAAPLVSDLPLPGTVAGLFRAAELHGPAERSIALVTFVRATHAVGASASARTRQYFDALAALDAAAALLPGREFALGRSSSPSPVLASFAAACGLAVVNGTLVDAAVPDAALRRRALEAAGVPLADWVRRLNAGETVRIEIPTEPVPLPLSPNLWSAAVFRRPVTRSDLARAVLGDPRASFLYCGLMALDDETLAYFAGREALVSSVAQRGAGAFAQWGRSIRIRGGRVALPGGDQAAALWEGVVGVEPRKVDEFVTAVLAGDGGRTAYFYDTIAHLDAERQAFALGAGVPAADRRGRFRALYGSFAGTRTFEVAGGWPRVRHPSSPAATLMQAVAGADGTMGAPSSRALWETASAGDPQACSSLRGDGQVADAAWLVERVEKEPLENRSGLLGAVTFAQRVFAGARPTDLPAVCEAVAWFPRRQALLLTLERLGFDAPADYVKAVRFAARLWSGFDRRAAVLRTAHAEGVLAILDRAAMVGALPRARARALAVSLTTLATGAAASGQPAAQEPALPPGAIAAWMNGVLLPELCAADASADPCFVRVVSGDGPLARPGGLVSWEDYSYRIDLGAATAVRIRLVREQQNAPRVDDALAIAAAGAAIAGPKVGSAAIEKQAASLKALARSLPPDRPELFWHAIPAIRAGVASAAARLGREPGASDIADTAASLVEAGDILLANALVSFAYAMAIGDPDEAVLLTTDPARRHQFDGAIGPAVDPWNIPDEVQLLDRSWVIQGSVLGLYTAYSRTWLRRLSISDPGTQPRPDPRDLRAFGETVAAFQPFGLTDASLDAIVSAIRRGRAIVAELVASPDRLWRRADEIGVSPERCRAALWVARAEPARAVELFSLSELMWLGQPALPRADLDRWGAATRMADTWLGVRMPESHGWEDIRGPRGVGLLPTRFADIHLRVAEALAELKLPAALAPAVSAYAAWDVLTAAQMAHPDDWFALARAAQALPADRFIDYVSVLTAFGPLVPSR
jgi:hypothetical protein